MSFLESTVNFLSKEIQFILLRGNLISLLKHLISENGYLTKTCVIFFLAEPNLLSFFLVNLHKICYILSEKTAYIHFFLERLDLFWC